MAQRILRPLSNADLFDEVFDIYKRHFILFVGIAAVMSVPTVIITHLTDDSAITEVLTMPFLLLEFAAITWAISQCYLGRSVGIIDSYRVVFTRSFSLVMSLILSIVILYVGFVLCVIPGILIAFWLVFTPPVIVIEQKRYREAIGRSRKLAAGNWGRIFIIGILIVLFCGVVEFVVSIPIELISNWLDANVKLQFGLLYDVVDGLSFSVFSVIPVIVLVLLYYDIRVRQEGFDIEMLARDIDNVQEGVPT